MNFTPTILDKRARFDVWQSEGFRFYFDTACLYDRTFKDIFLLQLDDCAVGPNNPRRYILNLLRAQVR